MGDNVVTHQTGRCIYCESCSVGHSSWKHWMLVVLHSSQSLSQGEKRGTPNGHLQTLQRLAISTVGVTNALKGPWSVTWAMSWKNSFSCLKDNLRGWDVSMNTSYIGPSPKIDSLLTFWNVLHMSFTKSFLLITIYFKKCFFTCIMQGTFLIHYCSVFPFSLRNGTSLKAHQSFSHPWLSGCPNAKLANDRISPVSQRNESFSGLYVKPVLLKIEESFWDKLCMNKKLLSSFMKLLPLLLYSSILSKIHFVNVVNNYLLSMFERKCQLLEENEKDFL